MLDPSATTQNGSAPASTVPSDLERVVALRKHVEAVLADDLQTQAVTFLEWAKQLRKGLVFQPAGVQQELQNYLGNDLALLGKLQATDGIEHPGTAPHALGRGRALGGGIG